MTIRSMRLAYPVNLEAAQEGPVLALFPDIPEALTEGATKHEALAESKDCLVAALGGYINARHTIPRPSPGRGRPLVALSALATAKVALYRVMREQGLSNAALAKLLGTAEETVQRLLDLDHLSRIDDIKAALNAVGQR